MSATSIYNKNATNTKRTYKGHNGRTAKATTMAKNQQNKETSQHRSTFSQRNNEAVVCIGNSQFGQYPSMILWITMHKS